MTGRETDQAEDRLLLRSVLSDIARLPAWVESLASHHAIPDNVKFAIHLCLEEAVSNVIRHGYGSETEGSVMIRFTTPGPELFAFVVEDEARCFNPLEIGSSNSQGPVRVGGQGIHFLRQFADTLEYERTPTGNRLRITFSAVNSAH